MYVVYKRQIDLRPHISNSYHNQSLQTSPISTHEQTSESLLTATSNDANKQLEPIVLYTHINKDQRPKIKYVMKTALSHISFWITNPNFISLQSDPLLIRLTAPCNKKRTNHKLHRVKSCFSGLQVLQQSNAHFYFRPSPQCIHIFREGRLRFQSRLVLRLTDAALCTRVYIRKGAHLGSLQPVLLSKRLTATDPIHRQHYSRQTPCTSSHTDTAELLSAQVKPRQYTLGS